jgi:hypothetical protein
MRCALAPTVPGSEVTTPPPPHASAVSGAPANKPATIKARIFIGASAKAYRAALAGANAGDFAQHEQRPGDRGSPDESEGLELPLRLAARASAAAGLDTHERCATAAEHIFDPQF